MSCFWSRLVSRAESRADEHDSPGPAKSRYRVPVRHRENAAAHQCHTDQARSEQTASRPGDWQLPKSVVETIGHANAQMNKSNTSVLRATDRLAARKADGRRGERVLLPAHLNPPPRGVEETRHHSEQGKEPGWRSSKISCLLVLCHAICENHWCHLLF